MTKKVSLNFRSRSESLGYQNETILVLPRFALLKVAIKAKSGFQGTLEMISVSNWSILTA
jgi:hypothetical protein